MRSMKLVFKQVIFAVIILSTLVLTVKVNAATVSNSFTSTSSKTVSMSKKATRTYSKARPVVVSNKKTYGYNKCKKIQINISNKRKITDKYTRGSKVKTVLTTVTTTYKAKGVGSEFKNDIDLIAPESDVRLRVLYKDLGYRVKINPKVNYTGEFSSSKGLITLKKLDTTAYHEIGHFLDMVVVKGSELSVVYNKEKNLYKGTTKKYVTSSKSEYFAESYREYVLDASKLKKERPKTYSLIKNSLKRLSDKKHLDLIKILYKA